MSLIYTFIVAIVSAIGSSAPLGPTNLWIVHTVFAEKRDQIWFFTLGVIVIDCLYAAVAFWGFFAVLQNSGLSTQVAMVAGLGIFIYGCIALYKVIKTSAAELEAREFGEHSRLKDFGMGVFLCGANPTFIIYWVYVAGLLNHYGVKELSGLVIAVFSLGIILGDVLWYEFFVWLVKKGYGLVQSRTVFWVRVTVALSFIGLGVITIFYEQLQKSGWIDATL